MIKIILYAVSVSIFVYIFMQVPLTSVILGFIAIGLLFFIFGYDEKERNEKDE